MKNYEQKKNELNQKITESRIALDLDELEQEQQDIQYEIDTGISREEENRKAKEIEKKTYPIPSYPGRRNDIWL